MKNLRPDRFESHNFRKQVLSSTEVFSLIKIRVHKLHIYCTTKCFGENVQFRSALGIFNFSLVFLSTQANVRAAV
jgi:hypothetical protein